MSWRPLSADEQLIVDRRLHDFVSRTPHLGEAQQRGGYDAVFEQLEFLDYEGVVPENAENAKAALLLMARVLESRGLATLTAMEREGQWNYAIKPSEPVDSILLHELHLCIDVSVYGGLTRIEKPSTVSICSEFLSGWRRWIKMRRAGKRPATEPWFNTGGLTGFPIESIYIEP